MKQLIIALVILSSSINEVRAISTGRDPFPADFFWDETPSGLATASGNIDIVGNSPKERAKVPFQHRIQNFGAKRKPFSDQFFREDAEKMDELPNAEDAPAEVPGPSPSSPSSPSSPVVHLPGAHGMPPAPTPCHPQCTWDCGGKCNVDCKPMCQPPKCETACRKPLFMNCRNVCDEPDCAVVCPKDTTCEQAGCPSCKTVCGKPKCKLVCPNAICQSKCADPVCAWQCSPSSTCKTPDCSLKCDPTPNCGIYARPDATLPRPMHSQEVAGYGTAKVPKKFAFLHKNK